MTNNEAAECVNLLVELFKDWRPGAKEIGEWVTYLLPYQSDTGKLAVRRLYQGKGLEHAPKPSVFRDVLANTAIFRRDTKPPPPAGNAWLICSDIDERGRGRVGMVQWIGWTNPIQPMTANPHLQAVIEENKRCCGGTWVALCGTPAEAQQEAWMFKQAVDKQSNPNRLMKENGIPF